MIGDKELFQMMDSREGHTSKQIHFISEEDAPRIMKIDARIQQIRKYQPMIIAGAIIFAFLVGMCV